VKYRVLFIFNFTTPDNDFAYSPCLRLGKLQRGDIQSAAIILKNNLLKQKYVLPLALANG
jgi:hypothetical protein